MPRHLQRPEAGELGGKRKADRSELVAGAERERRGGDACSTLPHSGYLNNILFVVVSILLFVFLAYWSFTNDMMYYF